MRDRGPLKALAIVFFSILVLLLMVCEEILRVAGFLVRVIVPEGFEAFLRRQKPVIAYAIFGVAFIIYVIIHVAEYVALWQGDALAVVILTVVSKVYFITVLGYLCRVYAELLLSVRWIACVWGWYLSAKEYLHSLPWYCKVHEFFLRAKTVVRRLWALRKKRTMFAVLWRLYRRRRSRKFV
jgi:hypothetical protein